MRISEEKREKISEQILLHLFSVFPRAIFTSYIANELARDEEFTKTLLLNLKEKRLIIEIKKNKEGISYIRRSRWKLSDEVYSTYKEHQNNQ